MQCPNIKYVMATGEDNSIGEPDKMKGVFLEYFLEFVINNIKATFQKICHLVTGPKVLKLQE